MLITENFQIPKMDMSKFFGSCDSQPVSKLLIKLE